MKLIHLFPDLMNLYGDYGNLRVLERALKAQGADVEVVKVHAGEGLDLTDASLVYMGPGTEPALHRALTLLTSALDPLRSALERQTPMLFTGNAWLLLGKSLSTNRDVPLPGLGLLDLAVTESQERLTCDSIARPADLGTDQPAVGFQNRCDQVVSGEPPLFTMELGAGNRPGDPGEGVRKGSLWATHLTGPLLVKNPHLLGALLSALGAAPAPPDREAQLAYQVTLDALRARVG